MKKERVYEDYINRIEYKCPNCGADLSFDKQLDYYEKKIDIIVLSEFTQSNKHIPMQPFLKELHFCKCDECGYRRDLYTNFIEGYYPKGLDFIEYH